MSTNGSSDRVSDALSKAMEAEAVSYLSRAVQVAMKLASQKIKGGVVTPGLCAAVFRTEAEVLDPRGIHPSFQAVIRRKEAGEPDPLASDDGGEDGGVWPEVLSFRIDDSAEGMEVEVITGEGDQFGLVFSAANWKIFQEQVMANGDQTTED